MYKNKIVDERATSSHRRKMVFVYHKIFTYIIEIYNITKKISSTKKFIYLDHFLLQFQYAIYFLISGASELCHIK